jgi:hypothetical protein
MEYETTNRAQPGIHIFKRYVVHILAVRKRTGFPKIYEEIDQRYFTPA